MSGGCLGGRFTLYLGCSVLFTYSHEVLREKAKSVSTNTAYPHIEKPVGEPARLRSTPRVRIAQIVMDYLAHGWSPEEMCRQHPGLRLAEIHAAMAYYYDEQSEIDAEIEAEVAESNASRSKTQPSFIKVALIKKGLL